jgi:hypothetical protein
VQTEVAVHRFLWTLGFPTDHMFRATVVCAGCSRDPFNDIRTAADNRPARETNVFEQASIERRAWTPLDSDQDEGWKWDDVYAIWSGNPDKRIQFEAYVLALNLVHFHNGISKQNTLACDPRTWDPATGSCGHPVIFLDDPGSSFGGGRQRGDYDTYRSHRVFLDGACTLRAARMDEIVGATWERLRAVHCRAMDEGRERRTDDLLRPLDVESVRRRSDEVAAARPVRRRKYLA